MHVRPRIQQPQREHRSDCGMRNDHHRAGKECRLLLWPHTAVIVAAALLVSGCGEPDTAVDKADVKTVVAANNEFTVDIYRQLKERSGNIFLSPFSVYGVLAMTCAGARGQ